MRRQSGTPIIPRITAALVAAALASTTLLPLAQAQGAQEGAAPAAKKEPDEKTRRKARDAFNAGKKAADKADYAAAEVKFKEANELIPSPHAMHWVAVCLDKQGKVDEAIAQYAAVLDDPKVAELGEEKVAETKARYKELRATKIATVNLTTVPAGAMVTVDGEAQPGETPLTLELEPGAHKLAITASGHLPKEVELNVEAGQALDENVELQPEPAPAPEPVAAPPPPPPEPPPAEPVEAEPESGKSMVPAYVTLGIAGAGAIVGTIFGVMALSKKSDFDDNPQADTADDVERNALIADMAFGVAITLGVTGIVLLTSDDEGSENVGRRTQSLPRQATLQVAPYVSPTGGGAAARVTF